MHAAAPYEAALVPLDAPSAARYLAHYVAAYRREYARLTAPTPQTPQGGGYPAIGVSHAVSARRVRGHLE